MNSDRKIKILFGINKLLVGGAERLVLMELQHIDRTRFSPYLVTLLLSSEPNLNQHAAFLGDRWVTFSFSGFRDVRSFWKLYRFLRRERFDVVVANLFFTGIVLRTAAFLARVPVILMTEVNTSTEEDERNVRLQKLLARVTSRFLAVSKEVLKVRARRLGIPARKFVLCYSSVDIHAVRQSISSEARARARATYHVGEHDVVIVTAGRLTEQKGHKYLIDAVRLIRSRQPRVSIKVIIFGEGAKRAELAEQIQRLDMTEIILLPGAADLPTILSVADVFVMPSLWEGLSVALIEAAVAGLPIVATEVSGTRKVVSHGVTGYVVPTCDSEALADKLQMLASDPGLRQQFSEATHQQYLERFSIEHRLAVLERVINESLNKHRS